MVVYTRIHLVIVSIHTPTQGVTTSIMYPAQASQFQSTHPRRVWPFCTFAMCSEYVSIHTPTQGVTRDILMMLITKMFQSTHPRRVWLSSTNREGGEVSFNPHTHAGCDLKNISILRFPKSFNPHTHAGCDLRGFLQYHKTSLFQSTHPRRVWQNQYDRSKH